MASYEYITLKPDFSLSLQIILIMPRSAFAYPEKEARVGSKSLRLLPCGYQIIRIIRVVGAIRIIWDMRDIRVNSIVRVVKVSRII